MTARLRASHPSRYGLLAGALVVVAVLIVATDRSGGSDGAAGVASSSAVAEGDDADAAESEALAEYEAALRPLLRDGGQVVVQGMRPGVADIAQGAFEDDVLVRMAAGWRDAMTDVAADVEALSVPPALGDAAAGYRRALRTYIRVAELLLAAARTGGDERDGLVEQAAELGRFADRQFDRAQEHMDAALERHRHAPGDPAEERGSR